MGSLTRILGDKLYGVYMYGATVFGDGGAVQDIDCHVILREPPTDGERKASMDLHGELAERFPPLGGELDAYFILLEEAKGASPPVHQLNTKVLDRSWALHCAHVRAGYYVCLLGPEPTEIFPAPSWPDISAALDGELHYVREHLCYPAYCILNLCRIMYSYAEKDPAVSKHFSGRWASDRFPEWDPLIQAAVRYYGKQGLPGDDRLMGERLSDFLKFATGCIDETRSAAVA